MLPQARSAQQRQRSDEKERKGRRWRPKRQMRAAHRDRYQCAALHGRSGALDRSYSCWLAKRKSDALRRRDAQELLTPSAPTAIKRHIAAIALDSTGAVTLPWPNNTRLRSLEKRLVLTDRGSSLRRSESARDMSGRLAPRSTGAGLKVVAVVRLRANMWPW